MPEPPDEDEAVLRDLIPERPDVTVKPMFGNLAAFVNGNMFMGLFGSSIAIKLAEADRATLSAIEGTGPFRPGQRPMAGYVAIPASWRAAPETALQLRDPPTAGLAGARDSVGCEGGRDFESGGGAHGAAPSR